MVYGTGTMVTEPREFSLPLPRPFSLRATVLSHGWYEIPPFRWEETSQTLSVAVRGPRGGARSLDLRQTGDGRGRSLKLRWRRRGGGEGSAGARARAQARVDGRALARRILNLGWDLEGFYGLCRGKPRLRWVVGQGAGRLLRGPSVFSDVVSSICGTNVQWKQAVRMVHRLCDGAPRVRQADPPRFPTAAELLTGGAALLRGHARLGYRADSVLRLCEQVSSGRRRLEEEVLDAHDGDALRRVFASLPGIGPVTARYLATLYGRFDEMAVDSLVLAYVGDRHFGGRRPTVAEVEAIYAPFGPWRSLAYWFEFLGSVDPVSWRGWKAPGASG